LKITDTEETDIIFAQEPYVYQNRAISFSKMYRVYTEGIGKTRTAITIRSNSIDALLIYNKSDEDTVVLELTINNMFFYAICMYFDIQDLIETTSKN
jgi:hypothetical protein